MSDGLSSVLIVGIVGTVVECLGRELGVGKGQYLGVLPTLIRYSLAALSSATPSVEEKIETPSDSMSLDVGLAFVEATSPKQLPRNVLVGQALEFIDNVLTLTSAVVATPTGTAALVDCGLIPALLTTVSVDPDQVLQNLLLDAPCESADADRIRALMGFITSQAVQILEGAIVTHSNALSAFHDLQGVDVMMKRLSREISATAKDDADGDVAMVDSDQAHKHGRRISSSQRVLLFGILTCLTVVFHQENSNSTSSTTPTGGAQLRKPELTEALISILDNIESYGGHLASLVATLLSDVMNSDPHVVHHVHKSGIAEAFLKMLLGKEVVDAQGNVSLEPIIPPVTELIMAIPNVIAALSLTEDGAKVVKKANPFPSLLRIFHHPNYAMPESRCLLNEMAAIVGTGLDEIIRHVERLRPQILSAVAEALNQVVAYADDLTILEQDPGDHPQRSLENMRTCLIQYVMNFAQLLEQILHNDEQCEPLVEAGGLDALLKIYPASMPCGLQFLAHVSGMSAPSVGTLHHSTLEEMLSVALKCLFLRYDTLNLIRKVTNTALHYLDSFDESELNLMKINDERVIDSFPLDSFLNGKESESPENLLLLSDYLRTASHVQWITNVLAATVETASQRSQDSGTGWSRTEREWKKELSSESFRNVIDRLSRFHRSSLLAVCRVRTADGFESREKVRLTTRTRRLRYRLRVVCPEGAILRDGIEIDSCANVGSLEMGEIVEAFDRCINSSGILRYRSKRGWVSEMTRGHGREPISEVISLWDAGVDAEPEDDGAASTPNRRIEAGVPDLRTVAAGVLARGQAGYTELFASLSKLVIQGIRSMPIRTLTFEVGTQGRHIALIVSLLAESLRSDLVQRDISPTAATGKSGVGDELESTVGAAGTAMYLGCVLSHLHECLFQDKRERRSVNFPLLVNLFYSNSLASQTENSREQPEVFRAFRHVSEHALSDFAYRQHGGSKLTRTGIPEQRVSRSVAASFPPWVSLLRKLISTPLSSSPAASIMSRMKWEEVARLLSGDDDGTDLYRRITSTKSASDGSNTFFLPEEFSKYLQISVSEVVRSAWLDPRFVYTPPFFLHPVATLVGEVLVCLEAASKNTPETQSSGSVESGRLLLSDFIRRRENEASAEGETEAHFEANEDSITQLMEMGFTRDHALDALESTRSNRVEVAMDYALSHPPPDRETIDRRRQERESRARRRQEQSSGENGQANGPDTAAVADNEAAGSTAAEDEATGEAMETEGTSDDKATADEDTPKTPSSDDGTARAKQALSSWLDIVPHVACTLLASAERKLASQEDEDAEKRSDGDAEGEALTVVLSSFLLDLCQRYPKRRDSIVTSVLEKIKSVLVHDEKDDSLSTCSVPPHAESGFASLCHAAVLFTRALPKTRVLVLKLNLVSAVVTCIGAFLESQESPQYFPLWMTPAILLLDIMAQPLVAFPDVCGDGSYSSGDGDLVRVRTEHKKQVENLLEGANAIFPVLSGTKRPQAKADSQDKKEESPTDDGKVSAETEGKMSDPDVSQPETSLPRIPAYFPLLSSSAAASCLGICHRLVVTQPDRSPLPPGLAHATLLLLLRLLRSPKVSAQCLRIGMAEALLNLPKESRFTGNSGLVTLIFRRFLEDEATLLSAMEIEIRSTAFKLGKKNSSSESVGSVALTSFLEAVTPLLCREPESFFKALALAIRVESSASNPSVATVALISPSERSGRLEKIAALKIPALEDRPECRRNSHKKQNAQKSRSKSPGKSSRRASCSKRNKKDRSESSKSLPSPHDSPSHHVAGLLITAIIASSADEASLNSSTDICSFLWLADLLEILADLILAVPACASAVHNYRPSRWKDKGKKGSAFNVSNAVVGSLAPPKTFISFALHSLLPRDRWAIKNDHQVWERRIEGSQESDSTKEKKAHAYRVVKVSQTTARVLAALVARPGEGRRRVIADLVFALSGGRLGHASASGSGAERVSAESSNRGLCALQAWGELCLGFAAPRSNGRNVDATTGLSIETLRIMLENGTVHALLYALKRVDLRHPMASNTCTVLLQPVEVLTRSSVAVAVKDMLQKESRLKDEQSNVEQESETGGNGRDQLDVSLSVPSLETSAFGSAISENQGVAHSEYDTLALAEEELNERSEDTEMDDGDEEDGSVGTHESSESDVSGDTGVDDDDDSSDVDDDDSEPSDAVEGEGDWDVDYNDDFVEGGNNDQFEYEEVEEEGTERMEQDVEEGWTRIESSGFGGMLLGSRRPGLLGRPGADAEGRARGVIDAAEAMIGNLLREADISSEALADIEESLGIRIMSGGRRIRASVSANGGGRGNPGELLSIRLRGGDEGGSRRADAIGTHILPHIHQRARPDVGYSAFGRGGLWADANHMEYVFGGPSITSGSRNYDLVSPRDSESDAETFPGFTQLDLQLFPGGPAAAASARTQHSLHPLLCGVDLPPVNSLVSDLLPHGLRAARRGQMATRRPGDWTNTTLSHGGYLVSTSNGNIIRSNRTHMGGPFIGAAGVRSVSGPVGWTDDGLPVDATVQELSAAVERALVPAPPRAGADAEPNDGAASSTGTNEARHEPARTDGNDDQEEGGQNSNPHHHNAGSQEDQEQESVRSDGDRVASSLAAGLRLSPRSEGSGNSNDARPPPSSSLEHSPNRDGSSEAAGAIEGEQMSSVDQSRANAAPTGQPSSNDNGNRSAPEQGDDVAMEEAGEEMQSTETAAEDNLDAPSQQANDNDLVCPPEVDPSVFHSLPVEMQRDCVAQYNATQELAAQLDGSTLDPEVLAALPEDMRQEVIEQDRRERMRQRNEQEARADPSQAEEMDNASFVASLAPQLREEILLTADDAFLSSLPPNIVAEAQILRERASTQHRRLFNEGVSRSGHTNSEPGSGGPEDRRTIQGERSAGESGTLSRRRPRFGKIRVETDFPDIVYLPDSLSPPVSIADMKGLIRMLYLLSPIRPPRLLQKVFQNLCVNPSLRHVLSTCLVCLLHEEGEGALLAVESFDYNNADIWRKSMDEAFVESEEFPPATMIGVVPDVPDAEALPLGASPNFSSRGLSRFDTAMSRAATLPTRPVGSANISLPPIVGSRIIDTIMQLCKNSPRFSLNTLVSPMQEGRKAEADVTTFERLVALLGNAVYARSASNLDQLLSLLECAVSPLSHISKHRDEEAEVSQREIDAAAAVGKEWVSVPRIEVSQPRLQLLCSILRMETCRDSAFTKVNTIVRRLCRIESNRGYVLAELAVVAHGLGVDALRDLRSLKIRMDSTVSKHQQRLEEDSGNEANNGAIGTLSGSITLSTSTSEVKLLRVLQTLQALCNDGSDDSGNKKNEGSVLVTEELVQLLRQMEFDSLWNELTSCLTVVQVLEGVKSFEEQQENANEDAENNDEGSRDENGVRANKLRNSAAGLLTRFLPTVESFFVANASATRSTVSGDGSSVPGREEIAVEDLVGGQRVIEFVSKNKVLLNALVRNNAALLDKGLRALVQVPRCRIFLDFDVKRQWFKTQVRRLRQHASRRHGSLRLHIRRKYVFEDAYHQLRLRNADEMRGRLHISFRNEEGVDAGGLSREFFAILAKEIFNPNYALFTSTEDGCTFQPNPNSSINGDHLSYFRFVGRIVGKAVADGFLLDAHFTRSLYKHMLGLKPTHDDMEAIDPDYYRNLKTILEFNLEDIGLDLTFSTHDNSFGRSQVIDLVPNGRKTAVTEENKEEYVRLVCQHRMTTAIQSQIKAYLDGFYELVSPGLIAIFTPRELELLISGMPDIDVHDLKKNTDYVGWKATDKQIEWFWNILFSLSRNEKAAFLQFVTGSSKVPLAGFAELQGMRGIQKFSIHKAGGTKGALMSAHTCFNSLDLPVYHSEDEMREKLLFSINEGGGAFLFA